MKSARHLRIKIITSTFLKFPGALLICSFLILFDACLPLSNPDAALETSQNTTEEELPPPAPAAPSNKTSPQIIMAILNSKGITLGGRELSNIGEMKLLDPALPGDSSLIATFTNIKSNSGGTVLSANPVATHGGPVLTLVAGIVYNLFISNAKAGTTSTIAISTIGGPVNIGGGYTNGLAIGIGALPSPSTTGLEGILFTDAVGSPWIGAENSTGNLVFKAGGSTRLVIAASGNVGIGTTAPTLSLEVKRPSTAGAVALFNDGASSGRSLILSTNQGGNGASLGITNGGHYWDYGVDSAGKAFISPGGSLGMIFSPLGVSGISGAYIGIGTNIPAAPLDVKRPTTAGVVAMFGDTVPTGRTLRLTTEQGGGGASLGIFNTNQYWDFGVSNTGKAFIAPGGSAGMTLSPVGVSGASGANMHMAGQITTAGNVGIGTTSATYSLTVNGEPGANGYTAFTNYSDRRLKENIRPLEGNTLNRILKLTPSEFTYNDHYFKITSYNKSTKNVKLRGFIAQELREVFPEMVSEKLIQSESYLDTNLSFLQVYLVQAVKELYSLIKDQNKDFDTLKKENKELKARIDKLEKWVESKTKSKPTTNE